MLDLVFAVLGVLLLLGCCHRCCLPAIVRGFAGRWAQLHFTHSNAHIPPLYLPKQQRLAIGAHLHADDGTPRKTLTTEGAVLGTSRGVRVATLLRVTIVKQQPDQPVGLQLVDLVTDANGWRREHAGGVDYYVHVKSRTTLAASADRSELAHERGADGIGVQRAVGLLLDRASQPLGHRQRRRVQSVIDHEQLERGCH